MFRLITHIITYNTSVKGRQAVSTDLIVTEYSTYGQIETAKVAFNGFGHGIGADGDHVGVSVRHVVLEL